MIFAPLKWGGEKQHRPPPGKKSIYRRMENDNRGGSAGR